MLTVAAEWEAWEAEGDSLPSKMRSCWRKRRMDAAAPDRPSAHGDVAALRQNYDQLAHQFHHDDDRARQLGGSERAGFDLANRHVSDHPE